MLLRKIFLVALVATMGIQSAYASDAPVAQQDSQSWSAWYKRNKVLVGAVLGAALVAFFVDQKNMQNNKYMQEPVLGQALVFGALPGALAAKFGLLSSYCGMIIGGGGVYLNEWSKSNVELLISAAVGSIINTLASKRNALPGFIVGGCGIAALDAFLNAPIRGMREIVEAYLIGSTIGYGVNEIYNWDQKSQEVKTSQE